MTEDPLKQLLDCEDVYDDSREDTLRAMLGDFYNKRMRSIVVMVWASGLIFMALAVLSAIAFFKSADAKAQLLYATIFICLLQWIGLLKVFAWQTIHRNNIKREIKRLEIRIDDLTQRLPQPG